MTARRKVRAGIIGCGNIAVGAHAPALRALADVEAVGVADPVAERRDEVRRLLDLPPAAAYGSHLEMLTEAKPDYVVLTVPQGLRRPILEDCARLGVHVLTEKPIATRPAEGSAFAELMGSAGLTYGMVHNYLFYPEYRLLRQLLDQGELGRLRHVGLHFMGVPDKPGHADYRPLWRHDRQEAGGGILMDMIHVTYLAEYFLGAEIQAVNAVIDNLDYPNGEVEDLALIQLYFPAGYATVNLGWGQGPGGIEVTGTEGRALVFYQDYVTGPFNELEEFVVVRPDGRKTYQPRQDYRMEDTFVAIHEDFTAAMAEGRDPVAPARAGVRGLTAALAAYASALTGTLIELPIKEGDPLYEEGLEGLRRLRARAGSPLVARRLFGLGAEEGVAA